MSDDVDIMIKLIEPVCGVLKKCYNASIRKHFNPGRSSNLKCKEISMNINSWEEIIPQIYSFVLIKKLHRFFPGVYCIYFFTSGKWHWNLYIVTPNWLGGWVDKNITACKTAVNIKLTPRIVLCELESFWDESYRVVSVPG